MSWKGRWCVEFGRSIDKDSHSQEAVRVVLVHHVVDIGAAGAVSDQRYLYSVYYEKMAQEGLRQLPWWQPSWGFPGELSGHSPCMLSSIADES